jgi:hypothetical protein
MKLYTSKVVHEEMVEQEATPDDSSSLDQPKPKPKRVRIRKPKVPVKEEEPSPIVPDELVVDTVVEESVEEPVEEPVVQPVVLVVEPELIRKKRTRVVEPPKWFKTFISNTKLNEINHKVQVPKEKKPRKVIKKEAEEYATDQWQDRFVRDSFTNQSDRHLDQLNHMYGQIFKR